MAKNKSQKVGKVKISACYMVKNAEKDLRRSLESLAKYVDEIIIVDTGSTDGTVKVAEEFGAKIFHEPWKNDFSTPRNIALREAKGDWIVFLDADEYFINDSAKNLQNSIKLAKQKNFPAMLINLVNIDADRNNEFMDSAYSLRVYANMPGIRYVGKIHEELYFEDKPVLSRAAAISSNKITLYHTGYSASINRSKHERNLKLLLEELATTDKPENFYGYLADAYYALGDWENLEKYSRLAVEKGTQNSKRPFHLYIECLDRKGAPLEEIFKVSKLAVERYPMMPEFSMNLAICFAKRGDYRAAVEEMRLAIKKFENYGDQFESTEFNEEKLANSKDLIDDWLKNIDLTPDEKSREVSRLVDELINYRDVLYDRDNAIKTAIKILELKPDNAEAVEKVTSTLVDYKIKGKAQEAVDYLEKNFPPTAYRLLLKSHVCAIKNDILGLIKFAEQALAREDCDLRIEMIIHSVLGYGYRSMGNPEKAVEHYRFNAKCDLSAQKNSPKLNKMAATRLGDYSNYLLNMHDLNFSREKIFEEICGFNKLLAHIPRFKHNHKLHSRHKKIRVGYISGDMRYHDVAFFNTYFFKGYDKTRFDVFIYANNLEDNITAQFRASVDVFRNILDMPADKVAAQIMKDEIDILVELAGHSADNLLKVMAYKPAPIQISGIGWFDSTGLDTIDYFLADKYTDPEGLNEKFFTEKILRLQHSHFCYVWHDYPYPVTPAPCTKNGYVTFVSFNNFSKVNDNVLKVWKKILDAVPNSRLYLKSDVFNEKGGLNFSRDRIKAAGIDLERVTLENYSKEYVRKYELADIALDTFPYPGGGTTCDALYMGLPVITLVGERHNSRFGYSLLMNIGLEELCAFSEEEYVQKAVELANDWDRIREYHLTIRRKMEESPVMTDTIYMGELEQAYEKIFDAWVNKKPLPDFPQEPEPITEELAEKYYNRAMDYILLAGAHDESLFESKFDFKRTLYYAELVAQCESKVDAKILLTIANRRYLLNDTFGAYKMMRKTVDYINSPKGLAENNPNNFIMECYKKLAKYALETGRYIESIESQQKAFELVEDEKNRLEIYDGLLLNLHFINISDEELVAFHFDYQNFFANVVPFTTYHKPHDRIKVGYISGDFRAHAAFKVMFGFIAYHDRRNFEITCYSKNPKNDMYTEQFRQVVEHFVDVQNLTDEELAKKIHDDEIDIAFDLAGHTGYNGLPALVYRPAPVQICGIGYMSTTGLKEIDYFITDEVLDPPNQNREQYFSEKFLYMPAQFCYSRPADVVIPNGASCMRNGYVTFGTICRYSKINDDSLAIWIEILNLVPTAKLLMRAGEFISNSLVDELYSRMKNLGCDMDRVIFRPAVKDTEYFETISKLDIVLDAYPYVGGVTTLDALYMGVPVINFYGSRHSTRFGKSILASVGLGELSVNSVEAYINTAVALANDFETIDVLHKNLRGMFENSAALDPLKYCRCLERKFEEILADARR